MEDLVSLGKKIKEKRLAMNLTMDSLASKVGITRATLCCIENGHSNCSVSTIFKILKCLDLSFSIGGLNENATLRQRATRINSVIDKKVNRFLIMCIEQYASCKNLSSQKVYEEMNKKGVLKEFKDDYEDLHGMSTMYLNDYIASLLRN